MALIESELGNALTDPVRRKANKTRNLRDTANRITNKSLSSFDNKNDGGSSAGRSKSSEVMIKITGFGKGAAHAKGHISYISREGNVELENNLGDSFKGKEEVKEFFNDWEKDFAEKTRRKGQRDTMHMVLSMPEGTNPLAVKNAVREFSKKTFGDNHEYVFALHTDEPHPHCHISVKSRGFDNTQLNPRKDDLQHWRETFAEELRAQGVVNAEATPRRSRGVVKKAESSVIRHIERGDKSHPPRISKVKAQKIKEIIQEITAEVSGQPVPEKPWETAIKVRQTQIRRAWLGAADALDSALVKSVNPITFNHKEVFNERPQYDQINAERIKSTQRAAALYQSNLEKYRPKAPPGHIASVRNLSSLAMVQHERSSEMLLQSNAFDRVGRQTTRASADLDVRRSGIGDSRAPGADANRLGYRPTPEENKTLAARIRGFVAAMPSLETERHQIKKALIEKFTIQSQKYQAQQPEGRQKPGLPPASQPAPSQDDHER